MKKATSLRGSPSESGVQDGISHDRPLPISSQQEATWSVTRERLTLARSIHLSIVHTRKKLGSDGPGRCPLNSDSRLRLPETITHEAKLSCTSEVLSAFFEQVKLLHEKLGPVLFQLPPSLQFDHARTSKFLSLLRRNFTGDVVWEPRHSSWFNNQVDDLLKKFRIARAAADPACVPAAAMPGGLSTLAYFRLHGSPRWYFSAYSGDFLNRLAAQLANLGAGARVWCIFDNTASGSAAQNALELAATLKLKKL